MRSESSSERALGKALGVVSLCIGATELLLPRRLERTMGVGNGQTTGVLRVLGIRESVNGLDLLTHHDTRKGILARCAGDLLDGALLGLAGTKTRKPSGFAMICAIVAPVVLLDFYLAARQSRRLHDRVPGLSEMYKAQKKLTRQVRNRLQFV